MPPFDKVLSSQVKTALSITKAGELSKLSLSQPARREWSQSRLEALYELAFLRVFAAWEMCLESVFYRTLCGYASVAGQEKLIRGSYFPNLAAAESAVLGKRSYILWHDPDRVIERCRRFIQPASSGSPCVQESMITANLARISDLARVRHRIVHDQKDAKQKFDAVTIGIAARTYASSRPGKFLRDWDTSVPQLKRWIEISSEQLIGMVKMIV